jgi:hypothetical protein
MQARYVSTGDGRIFRNAYLLTIHDHFHTCEISGSHGGEYEDDSLLGY